MRTVKIKQMIIKEIDKVNKLKEQYEKDLEKEKDIFAIHSLYALYHIKIGRRNALIDLLNMINKGELWK